jgi:hypothetical protein
MTDQLDHAIDAVAAQLTRVPPDDGLADRIVRLLPERRRALWRLIGPAFAAIAVVVVGLAVVLRTFDDRSTGVLRTGNTIAPIAAFAASVERSSVELPQIDRRTFVERSSKIRRRTRVADGPDHEFALPSIGAVAALTVDTLIPASLLEDEPLTVAPLTIEPLTLDPFSPR